MWQGKKKKKKKGGKTHFILGPDVERGKKIKFVPASIEEDFYASASELSLQHAVPHAGISQSKGYSILAA